MEMVRSCKPVAVAVVVRTMAHAKYVIAVRKGHDTPFFPLHPVFARREALGELDVDWT